MRKIRELLRNCDGVTSIEYGLIAVLISIFLIVGASYMGTTMGSSLNSASNGLAGAR